MKPLNVDFSAWGQIAVTGDDRARFLHGLCTSNVLDLEDGDWIRASVLTVKARLVSVIEILNRGDHLLLLCEPDRRDPTIEFLDQFAMVDDVEFEPVERPAYKVWDDPGAVWEAPAVMAPPPDPVASAAEVEVRRIEAGFPRFGVDVTDKNFPFETPLDRHIDSRKGCYIGQETVARVASRGSANKFLRGLRVEGDEPVRVGAPVDHGDRKGVAKVTSAAVSPEFGAIALALIPRAAWDVGTEVSIEGRAAVVTGLPLGRDTC